MRRRIAESLAVVLSVASLGAGAASGRGSSEAAKVTSPPVIATSGQKSNKKHKSQPYQVGTASWYGDYFQGKPTASGEPFDMHDFTAAHPSLPLGTFVRVTNLRNGKVAVVRINDRGPVVDGRIIDVSYNAARALGFKERGLQKVRLDIFQPTTLAQLQPVAKLN
jgi:rare lipoprotein A